MRRAKRGLDIGRASAILRLSGNVIRVLVGGLRSREG